VSLIPGVVMSLEKQFHPVEVGKPITPLVAEPPVPTFIRKDDAWVPAEMDGLVPNPEEIVGTTPEVPEGTPEIEYAVSPFGLKFGQFTVESIYNFVAFTIPVGAAVGPR
jgi:hypothetical protein